MASSSNRNLRSKNITAVGETSAEENGVLGRLTRAARSTRYAGGSDVRQRSETDGRQKSSIAIRADKEQSRQKRYPSTGSPTAVPTNKEHSVGQGRPKKASSSTAAGTKARPEAVPAAGRHEAGHSMERGEASRQSRQDKDECLVSARAVQDERQKRSKKGPTIGIRAVVQAHKDDSGVRHKQFSSTGAQAEALSEVVPTGDDSEDAEETDRTKIVRTQIGRSDHSGERDEVGTPSWQEQDKCIVPTDAVQPPVSTSWATENDSAVEVKHVVEQGANVAPIVDLSPSPDSDAKWTLYTSVPPDGVKLAVQDCEFGFRYKVENRVTKGRVQYYYCRRIKAKASKQCERRLMVFIPNGSDVNCSINLRGTHTCGTAKSEDLAKIPLSKKDVAEINDLLHSGIPLKDIKKHIRASNQQVSKNRVNYAVKQASQALYGCGELSLGDLAAWAKLHSTTPPGNETGFVIGSDFDGTTGRFRLVYSSKKLMSRFSTLDVLSADCTFKTTLQGYPLVVVCLVDKMRHAHPVAFASITKQEEADYYFVLATLQDQCNRMGISCSVKAFISDGEIALKKAARSVFGEHVLLVNCYFHVVQNIKKYLTKAKESADHKERILKDVNRIQVAPTPRHFDDACGLFCMKYGALPGFVQFFEKYIDNEYYKNWYECALPGYPATNNSLEALNRAIKDHHLDRTREPFGTFKTKIMKVVEKYGADERIIYDKRLYTIEDERRAFNFIRAGKRTRIVQDWSDRAKYMYFPTANNTEVTVREIEVFNNPDRRSLEHYLKDMELIYCIGITDDHWTTWNCSCRWFSKHNSCYHVVVAAVTTKKYQLRPEANTSSLTQKRPPGRPKKMTKALIVD